MDKKNNKVIEIRLRDFTEYKQISHKKVHNWNFYMNLFKAVNEKISSEKDIVYCTSKKYKDEKLPELFTILPNSLFVNGYVGKVYVSDIEIPKNTGRGTETVNAEITIESRLDYNGENEEAAKKKYFLITLLSRGQLNKAFGDSEIDAKSDNIFWFLIMFMYINTLEEAVKGGLYKEYVKYKKNDLNVRGRIDVPRHIKENILYRDRIAYEYGEQTYDNPLNRLILAAADVLKKYNLNEFLPSGVKNALSSLRQQVFSYSCLSAAEIGRAASKPVTKSFYIKYEEVRRVCLKVLRNEGVNIFDRGESKTRGLLMYVPELWENLVLHYFNRYLTGFKTEAQYSYDIMLEEDRPWGIGPNTSRPDMVIKRDGEISAVIDAKYKPGWMDGGEYAAGTRRLDINQVKAYMYDLNCKKGGIIYPSKAESAFRKYKSSGLNSEDFCVITVSIPEINNYEAYPLWRKRLDNSFNVITELTNFIQNP